MPENFQSFQDVNDSVNNRIAPRLNNLEAQSGVVNIPVENLAADGDIAARPVFVMPVAVTILSATILTQGAPAGVDNSNTAVIALKDAAGNTITTKTYNTATQPPSSAYGDLGTPDATHKFLTANEAVTLTVTTGSTADLPAFVIALRYAYTQ